MTGQWRPGDDLLKTLRDEALEGLRSAGLGLLGQLLAPVLAGLILRAMLGEREASASGLGMVCRAAVASVLVKRSAELRGQAVAFMALMNRFTSAAAPVYAAALLSTGAAEASAAISPLAALCGQCVEKALSGVGLALCGACGVIAICGNLTSGLHLNRLFELVKGLTARLIALTVGLFTLVIAVEGRLVSGSEGVLRQVVRSALEGGIPIIGGEVSGALGTLAGSAAALKRAIGAAGMLLATYIGIRPLIAIAATTLCLKLAAAVMEPLAEPQMSAMASQFGDAAELVLALCVGGLMLAVILSGGCLAMEGSIA